jgi:aminoglycoside phosphotransferase (APT) family kinase protein
MLISSKRILQASAETLRKMSARTDLPADVIPDCEMMAYLLDQIALDSDSRLSQSPYQRVAAIVEQWQPGDQRVASFSGELDKILRQYAESADPVSGHLAVLDNTDRLIADTISQANTPAEDYLSLARELFQWEKEFIVDPPVAVDRSVVVTEDFTPEKVQRYFDDRFPGQGSKVNVVRVLPGGYGKQTIMIEMDGGPYPGSLVVRRDMSVAVLDNDCHFVRREFPLLQALFRRGFPVPEVLWLEQGSDILPGGDFIVSRKVEGQVQGDVLGTAGDIPEVLVDQLAKTAARLHQLSPLTEMGSQVASLDASLWQQSITTCGRKYIESFYDFFRTTPTIPQPALTAMFGWLVNNIPECDEQPALIHGDLGFHNFLVDNNRITCLLDWEFGHVGDPAEDIGFIKSSIGDKIDWQHFLDLYEGYGGRKISPERILFYQVWTFLRNAVGCAISGYRFGTGDLEEVKLGIVPYRYIPIYIEKCLGYIENAK